MSVLSWEILMFVIPVCLGCLLALGAALGLAEQDTEGDADIDPDGDSDDAGSTGLEIGRPPLVIRMMTASLGFGSAGLSMLYLLGSERSPVWTVSLATGVAFLFALVLGRVMQRVFRARLRLIESAAVSRHELVGCLGKVVLRADANGGMVHVYDRHGDLHQIVCRAASDEPALLPGSPVLVTEYDEERNVVEVMRRPASLGP